MTHDETIVAIGETMVEVVKGSKDNVMAHLWKVEEGYKEAIELLKDCVWALKRAEVAETAIDNASAYLEYHSPA